MGVGTFIVAVIFAVLAISISRLVVFLFVKTVKKHSVSHRFAKHAVAFLSLSCVLLIGVIAFYWVIGSHPLAPYGAAPLAFGILVGSLFSLPYSYLFMRRKSAEW